ncbi:Probable serine/threonine-protein kinase WNK2 [Galdieria sulphuraria]|nr:Probable serine/threonine-protein kinase WNK2 [Galdieria sulphuraria]
MAHFFWRQLSGYCWNQLLRPLKIEAHSRLPHFCCPDLTLKLSPNIGSVKSVIEKGTVKPATIARFVPCSPIFQMEESLGFKADEQEYNAESDPTGRYVRSNVELGRGAYKTVYKAFDRVEALEVAWNKLHVERFAKSDIYKVLNEVELLRKLRHKNILVFHAAWQKEDQHGRATCDFITELMTSGTLKEYIKKAQTIKVKVIRRWGENILEAIEYLHSQNPPIMHRDLKCDNIFINGNTGTLKVGDLGLSAVRDKPMALSVLGTPEFMAPELYEEKYSEKVDIYAFGMCLLEMVTMEYPYSECKNAAQIFRKVMRGEKPNAFKRLKDCEIKRVIAECLLPERQRPSASDLLHLDLFTKWEEDDGVLDNRSLMCTEDELEKACSDQMESSLSSVTGLSNRSNELQSEGTVGPSTQKSVKEDKQDEKSESRLPYVSSHSEGASMKVNGDLASCANRNLIFHGDSQFLRPVGNPAVELLRPTTSTDGVFRLCLQIPVEGSSKKIEFDFDPRNDSPESLAEEMVIELNLNSSQLESIKEEIENQMVKILHSIPSDEQSQRMQDESCNSEKIDAQSQTNTASEDASCHIFSPRDSGKEVVPIVIVGPVLGESNDDNDSESSTSSSVRDEAVVVHKSRNVSPLSTLHSRRKAVSDGENSFVQPTLNGTISRDSRSYPLFMEDSDIEDVGLGFSLMEAVARNDSFEVQRLLDKGAPVTYFDYDRRTPLHVAASEGNVEVAKLLVERGASTEARDRWGSTPVLEALVAGHKSLAKMLRNASRPRSWLSSCPSSARSQMSASPARKSPNSARTPRIDSLNSQQAMSAEDLVSIMYGQEAYPSDETESIRASHDSSTSDDGSGNISSPYYIRNNEIYSGRSDTKRQQNALTKNLDALNIDLEHLPLHQSKETDPDSDEEEELRRLEEAFLKELLELERKRQQAILDLRQRLSEKKRSSSASLKDFNVESYSNH